MRLTMQVTSLVITDKNPADREGIDRFQRVANARTGNIVFDKDGNEIGLVKPKDESKRR